jgi:hypothetical protein
MLGFISFCRIFVAAKNDKTHLPASLAGGFGELLKLPTDQLTVALQPESGTRTRTLETRTLIR